MSKKQALRQFELERAEEQLSTKSKLKDELQAEINAAEVFYEKLLFLSISIGLILHLKANFDFIT